MRRNAMQQLYDWKEKSTRKPLIIRGARQVGKTWLMKEFAATAYKQFAYINFEDNEVMKEVFQKDFDIERILMAIQLVTGKVVDTDTLILFDELQEAPRGLTAMKYFLEKAPQYHVIAAGSLLGIAMHQNDSFPVGKVDFIDLYPLSFSEFLEAIGQESFVSLLAKQDWNLISTFRSKFTDFLKQYYFVGGMPEVVNAFIEHKDYTEVRQLQQNILDSYDRDFSKHAPIAEVPRIRMVWRSVPAQLAKENRKFIYGVIKEGARAKVFQRMFHGACESAVRKLYPCHLVNMLHVISPYMFYDPVFPHIRHTVAVHKPSPFWKRVILVHFMYYHLVNFQFCFPGTWCGFLSP